MQEFTSGSRKMEQGRVLTKVQAECKRKAVWHLSLILSEGHQWLLAANTEFSPWSPRGKRRAPTATGCPLTSMGRIAQTHKHTHTQLCEVVKVSFRFVLFFFLISNSEKAGGSGACL